MRYAVGEIVRDVRVALDENEVQTALIAGDSDSLQLDGLIMQKILHAIRDISLTAPVAMLSDAPQMAAGPITWGDGEYACGSVALPDDFLRLVAFRMSDWQRSVSAPIYAVNISMSGKTADSICLFKPSSSLAVSDRNSFFKSSRAASRFSIV